MKLTTLLIIIAKLCFFQSLKSQCNSCDQSNLSPGASAIVPAAKKWCYSSSNSPAYFTSFTVNGSVDVCGGNTLDVFGSFTIDNGHVTLYGCSKLKVFGTFNDKHAVKVTAYCGDCGGSYVPVNVTGSMVYTGANCYTSLPIDLIDFDVRILSGLHYFKWATASETNNDFFTIEGSRNAEDWEIVTRVKGAGNSMSLEKYSFSCSLRNNPYKYFRLKQTDYSGLSTYSEIMASENDIKQHQINVYPNPLRGSEELKIQVDGEKIQKVEVFNSTGLLLYRDYNVTRGRVPKEITQKMRNGLFYVNVVLGNGKQIVKKIQKVQ